MGLGCRPAVLTETVPRAKHEGPGSGAWGSGADLGAGPHLPGPAPAPQLSYLQGPAAGGGPPRRPGCPLATAGQGR